MGWNDKVKPVIKRKEDAWKQVLELEMKLQKKDVWKGMEKKRERLKGIYIKAERR